MVGRGLLEKATKAQLCDTAQEQFDVFCTMSIVPMGQLYGGKICATLDRQHPRGLFDVKLLFENEGFTDEVKRGVIFGLVSSNRPTLQLIEAVNASLDEDDKAFLLSLNRLAPDWSIYDYQDFPSVKWKLLNLEKFKRDNLGVYQQQLIKLEDVLG